MRGRRNPLRGKGRDSEKKGDSSKVKILREHRKTRHRVAVEKEKIFPERKKGKECEPKERNNMERE